MTSLTQIAITARKSIRYTIFVIIFLIVGKMLLDASVGIYLKIFPPGPPPPTVKFGKLTQINFPTNNITAKLTYTLETPEGGLPTNIPTQAKVYFMPKVNATLLSLDVAKAEAKALNYDDQNPQQQSDTLYKFKNPNFPSTFQINIITGAFSISYDLSADRSPISTKPPVAEIAASEFRSSLSAANVLPDDLTGPMTSQFYKLSGGQMTTALALSESDVVKVNLFRKNYDNLPSVTADPNQANVWAIISGSTNNQQQIMAAEYHYNAVDETQFATYPIKTPTQAYSEFQAGQSYIANLGLNKDGGNVTIRRVYLAYFDPPTASDFFQPIYVFEGDNGFVAYVPAVTASNYVAK